MSILSRLRKKKSQTKQEMPYKVEEHEKGGKTITHEFVNYDAARRATNIINGNGNPATMYKRDSTLSNGWSKIGSYVPASKFKYLGTERRSPRISPKCPRISPKFPKLK